MMFSVSNEKIFDTLEFDKVRQRIKQYTQTELAQSKIANMKPSNNYESGKMKLSSH